MPWTQVDADFQIQNLPPIPPPTPASYVVTWTQIEAGNLTDWVILSPDFGIRPLSVNLTITGVAVASLDSIVAPAARTQVYPIWLWADGGSIALLLNPDLETGSPNGIFGVDPNHLSLIGVNTTSGSAVVTVSDTTGLQIADYVIGPGLVSGTQILSVDSGTQITLSAPATATLIGASWNATPGVFVNSGYGVLLVYDEDHLIWRVLQTELPPEWSILGRFPDAGPFPGSPLIVDQGTGLVVDSGPRLALTVASYTDPGTLSSTGLQQLRGALLMAAPVGFAGPAPPWDYGFYSAVMQNGRLAFYNDAEGSTSDAATYIGWEGAGPGGTMRLQTAGNLILHAGTSGVGLVQIVSNDGAAAILMDDPTPMTFQSTTGYSFGTPILTATLPWSPVLPNPSFDLQSFGNNPYYSLQGDTLQGQYGTLIDGSTVSGGIITAINLSGIPWSDILFPPTTLAGYGITDALSTSTVFGGDVTGLSTMLAVNAIQNQPLALGGSPTAGDVLTWSGAAWANAAAPPPGGPAGGDLAGSYPNPTVATVGGIVPILTGDAAGGDLTGTYPNPSVVTVGGIVPMLTGDPAGADLIGNYPNPTVIGIQGRNVSSVAPNPADVLTWDGSFWAPIPVPAGGITIGNPVGGGLADCVLFEDTSGFLAQDPNFTYGAGVGLYVAIGSDFASLMRSGVAGQFTLGGHNTSICDGTYGVNTDGPVLVNGNVGQTYTWSVDGPAPTVSAYPGSLLDCYGASNPFRYLSDPDIWLRVDYAGSNYVVPGYLA